MAPGRSIAVAIVMIVATSCGEADLAAPETECRPPTDGVLVCVLATQDGPVGRLITADDTSEGVLGSYCWETIGVGECGDIGEIPRLGPPLALARGMKLALVHDAERIGAEVGELTLVDGVRQLKNLADFDIRADTLRLKPGSYVLDVFGDWEQGDGEIYFPIEVSWRSAGRVDLQHHR